MDEDVYRSENLTQAMPVLTPVWKSGTCWGLLLFGAVMFLWEIDSWCSGTLFTRFKIVFDWLKIALDWFVGHPIISFPCLYLLGHYYWPNRRRLVSARKHRRDTHVELPESGVDTRIRDSLQS